MSVLLFVWTLTWLDLNHCFVIHAACNVPNFPPHRSDSCDHPCSCSRWPRLHFSLCPLTRTQFFASAGGRCLGATPATSPDSLRHSPGPPQHVPGPRPSSGRSLSPTFSTSPFFSSTPPCTTCQLSTFSTGSLTYLFLRHTSATLFSSSSTSQALSFFSTDTYSFTHTTATAPQGTQTQSATTSST